MAKAREAKPRKRSLFGELMSGVGDMKKHRQGQLTLRTHKVPVNRVPRLDARAIRATRRALHMSRGVFARKLRVNERTLERWEQGRSVPNEQAAALILLVREYPDTLERLERVASGT